MTDEEKAARAKEIDDAIKKHDAAKGDGGATIDKILVGLDAIGKRMDAMEKPRAAPTFSPRQPADDDKAYAARHDDEEKKMVAAMQGAGMPEGEASDAAQRARQQFEAADHDPDARGAAENERLMLDGHRRADAIRKHEAALADAQARCDSVAAAWGEKAPPPFAGEAEFNYRRRLAQRYQHHSAAFKSIDLGTLPPEAFGPVERIIYTDALTASANPGGMPDGRLREIITPDKSGRQISTFFGDRTFIRGMMRPARRVSRFLYGAHAAA